MLGIACIEGSEIGAVVQISGLNSKHHWFSMIAEMPMAKKGELVVHFDSPPQLGTGVTYDRSWRTYYSQRYQCICMGNPKTEDGDDFVEFVAGIVAVLRNGQLVAVWSKIREVETAP